MLCLKARCSFPSFALHIKKKDLRGNENHCTTSLSRAEQIQQVSWRDLCRCMVLWTHREIRFCVLQLMVTLLHMRTYRRGPSLDHWKSMKIVKIWKTYDTLIPRIIIIIFICGTIYASVQWPHNLRVIGTKRNFERLKHMFVCKCYGLPCLPQVPDGVKAPQMAPPFRI